MTFTEYYYLIIYTILLFTTQEKLELLEKLEMTTFAEFMRKWNLLAAKDSFEAF